MTGSVADRLISKAEFNESSGCWVWSAARDGGGYGVIRIDGKTCRVHRVSYELHHGPIPDGLFVCHKCDNRPCINPSHLFLGTQADNMADRDAKGRNAQPHGECHGSAKLTEADILSIRAATGGWGLLTRLARQYGVTRTQISHVRSGENWSHEIIATEKITGPDSPALRAAKALMDQDMGEMK